MKTPFRFPLRYQISGLLMIFTAAVALLSMRSTQDFLSKDKIATVRELQALQVAQTTADIRQRILNARNQFRENLPRLQNVAGGQIDLDPKSWRLMSVQDKVWRSPEGAPVQFPAELASANPERFQIIGSAQMPSELILLEPLFLQEGANTRKVVARAIVDKSFLLGEDLSFRQGLSQGLLVDFAAIAKSTDKNYAAHEWGGTPESMGLFQQIEKLLPPELKAKLSAISPPSVREIPTPDGENSYLFAWASITLGDSDVHLKLFQFVDRESILKGFRRFLYEQGFMAFLLLGFGVIVALWLARRLSKPIEALVTASKTLETGNFQVRVAQDRADEIGDLGGAFNHMAQSLHDREEALKAAQSALVQNEKLAALGTLSAGIAHEVKNPLAGILGNADMAINQLKTLTLPENTPLFRYMEIIQKETKRCRGIVDSLMRFSRQEKAEQVMVDLEVVAWEAIHLMEHSLNLAKVRVEKNFAESMQMIKGNANQVEQVLLNMLQNGGHAMPDGGTIRIGTEFHSDPSTAPKGKFTAFSSAEFKGPFCRIYIQDQGIGMTEEVQKKIFEPFFTTKPKGVGTGLGLSVTMGILGDHHARVTLTSAPGQGTTFFLDFVARGERNAEVQAQLEEIQHRKGGGASVGTDFQAGAETVKAPEHSSAPKALPTMLPKKPPTPTSLKVGTTVPGLAPTPTVIEPVSRKFQMRKPKVGGSHGGE